MNVYYVYEEDFKNNNYNKFHAFTGKNAGGRYISNIKSVFVLWNDGDSRFIADGQATLCDGVAKNWKDTQKKIVEWIFDGTFKINSTTEIRVKI